MSAFKFLAFVVSALLSFAVSQTYPNVKLEVYYEALCPGCQGFITGPLTNTLALPDIVAITDLKMVPYGNTKKNTDGTFTCQHGEDECTSDVLELCTLYKLSGNLTSINNGDTSLRAFPFLQCMEINEGASSAAANCYANNMKGASATWSDVTTCAANEASVVQNQAMSATPTHDYVPWVLVNSVLVENTNALLVSICKAYTGPAPASCKRLYQNNDNAVCMNK